MSIYDYKDPIITRTRKGTSDDPYVDKEEWFRVERGRVVLTELPCEFNRVAVTGGNKTWVEKMSGVPKENEYVVDYTNKIVHFHPSNDGLNLLFKYMGRGLEYIPATSIYTKTDGYNVLETLQDVLNQSEDILEIADRFRYVNNYQSDKVYYHRNIVKFNNSTYICIDNSANGIINQSPIDHPEKWHLLSTVFSPKGTYDNDASYYIGDIVINDSNDAIYLSLIDNNVGNSLSDTNYWISLIDIQELTYYIKQQEENRQIEEAVRQSNEDFRQVNESERQSNEQNRLQEESVRQNNEIERQEKIDNLIAVGDFDYNTVYQPRNIVRYNGSAYMCIKESVNIFPTDTDYWRKFVDKGEKGEQGIKGDKGSDGLNLVFKGIYDNNIHYNVNDLVRYNDGLYVCIQNSIGNSPLNENYWTIYFLDGNYRTGSIEKTKYINYDTNEVEIGISSYHSQTDTLMVFVDGDYIVKDIDYTVDPNSEKIIKTNGNWGSNEEETEFHFIVLKNVRQDVDHIDGGMIEDNSIGNEKLKSNIKIGSLNDINESLKDMFAIEKTELNIVNILNYLIKQRGLITSDFGFISEPASISVDFGFIADDKEAESDFGFIVNRK